MVSVVEQNLQIFEVSVFNNSLYWTVLRVVDSSATTVTSPGALYHAQMGPTPTGPRVLAEGDDWSPQGVCTFHNVSGMCMPWAGLHVLP